MEHHLAGGAGNTSLLTSKSTVPMLMLKLTLGTFGYPESPTKISKTIDMSDNTCDYCSILGLVIYTV